MRVLIIADDVVANVANFADDHVLAPDQLLADDFPGVGPGAPVVGGRPVVPEPPSVSLDDARSAARRRLVAWIDGLTAQLRNGYPRDEVASWTEKATEARALLAGGAARPMLTREAELRGVPPEELARTVIGHADRFAGIMGAVAGLRATATAAIDAATTPEAVAAALTEALADAATVARELGLTVPEARA